MLPITCTTSFDSSSTAYRFRGPEVDGEVVNYMQIHDMAGLVATAQLGTLELHRLNKLGPTFHDAHGAARLARLETDPWTVFLTTKQAITQKMWKAIVSIASISSGSWSYPG